MTTPSRRSLLTATAVSAGALFLKPMEFASAAGGTTETHTITGHLDPGAADWVYLPVDVPAGVRRIDVSYSYDKPAQPPGTVTKASHRWSGSADRGARRREVA